VERFYTCGTVSAELQTHVATVTGDDCEQSDIRQVTAGRCFMLAWRSAGYSGTRHKVLNCAYSK